MVGNLHKELQQEAIYWLYKNGCYIYADEISIEGGYIIDVMGVKTNGATYCIEVKATQEDLDKARQETFPRYASKFNYHYLYIAPELKVKSSWEGWGIIQNGYCIKKPKRFENDQHFITLIDLLFRIGSRMCREKYFNNFREKNNYD